MTAAGFGFRPSNGTSSLSSTTTASSLVVPPNTNNAAGDSSSQILIPSYTTAFPHVELHNRIVSTLLELHRFSIREPNLGFGATNSIHNGDSTNMPHRLNFLGKDLIHLLSSSARGDASTHIQSYPTTHHAYGFDLACPESILRHYKRAGGGPDKALRERILARPFIQFEISSIIDGGNSLKAQSIKELEIPPYIASLVFQLADELEISELHAFALYSYAASEKLSPLATHSLMQSSSYLNRSALTSSTTQSSVSYHDVDQQHLIVMANARSIFFQQLGMTLRTLHTLIKYRLSSSRYIVECHQQNTELTNHINTVTPHQHQFVVEATDLLLQRNLVSNLISLIRYVTDLSESLQKKLVASLDPTNVPTNVPSSIAMMKQFYSFYLEQRLIAVDCLFFLAYHTQLTGIEVVDLIDLIRDLTNGSDGSTSAVGGSHSIPSTTTFTGSGLPVLDPLRDVPDLYELAVSAERSSMTPMAHQQQDITLKEKGAFVWEQELVDKLWSFEGFHRATVTTATTILSPSDGGDSWAQKQFVQQQTGFGANIGSTNLGTGITVYNSVTIPHAIEGGKPQLLQTVSILILTIFAALDVDTIFMDRSTHAPNLLGEGNCLLPSSAFSLHDTSCSLSLIYNRLDPNKNHTYSKWRRIDILGLLSASYALLLRKYVLKEAQASTSSTTTELRNSFQTCLEFPTVAKSLTFARLSLLPSLGGPYGATIDDSHADSSRDILDSDFFFYTSVLSDFTSAYLDTMCSIEMIPISRAKWLKEEEQELQLRQVQKEQKKQFRLWSGQGNQDENDVIPTEVDIRKRPDCLDDLVCLAIAICSACPDCTFRFWSLSQMSEAVLDEERMKKSDLFVEAVRDSNKPNQLKPSPLVLKLQRLASEDESLLPVYLSYLAILSLCPSLDSENKRHSYNGASVVHQLLSNPSTNTDMRTQVNWFYVLNVLRWYANVLHPSDALFSGSFPLASGTSSTNVSFRNSSSQIHSSGDDFSSLSYFYTIDATKDIAYNTSQNAIGGSMSATAAVGKQERIELNEFTMFHLLSLLSLISHVALHCSSAKLYLLELSLPTNDSDTGTIFLSSSRMDDIISILFSLSTSSIPSDIRGFVFSTIADLIRCDDYTAFSDTEKLTVLSTARRAWDLLEASGIIPISLLSQYPSAAPGNTIETPTSSRPLLFPANVTIKPYEKSCWFPPSEQYGIIYEMEYIESMNGKFPATEGILKLLASLILTIGCPADLGKSWRTRSGPAPYLEYVTNFVLPRTLGTKDDRRALQFASSADKLRLIARCLEVIDVTIISYDIVRSFHRVQPPSSVSFSGKNIDASRRGPHSECNCFSLVDSSIFITLDESCNSLEIQNSDFESQNARIHPVVRQQYPFSTDIADPKSLGQSFEVPLPKSPQFALMSDILSSSSDSMFCILASVLTENENLDDDISVRNNQTFRYRRLALALYGETLPVYATIKLGRDLILNGHNLGVESLQLSVMSSEFIQLILKPLYTPIIETVRDKVTSTSLRIVLSSFDAVAWCERCVFLVLHILCAAAAREDEFSRSVEKSVAVLSVVPVLKFRPPNRQSAHTMMDFRNVKLSSLAHLVTKSDGMASVTRDSSILSMLANYVGYHSVSMIEEDDIARAALSLIFYVSTNISHRDFVASLCGTSAYGPERLTKSFAQRIYGRSETSGSIAVKEVILDMILSYIEVDLSAEENLSHVLLGLTGWSLSQQSHALKLPLSQQRLEDFSPHRNLLDAILALVSNYSCFHGHESSSLVSKSLQLIYRLIDAKHDRNCSSSSLPKLCVLAKLRLLNFWKSTLLHFFGPTESLLSMLQVLDQSCSSADESTSQEAELRYIQIKCDFLHCMAWILKGVTVNIVAVGNKVVSPSSMTSMISDPSLRRLITALLFYGDESLLLRIFAHLPRIDMNQFLLDEKYLPLLEQYPSKPMVGPKDVCKGYEIIDINRFLVSLSARMNQRLDMQEDERQSIRWVQRWNLFVHYVCATSHLAQAFGLSLRALVLDSVSFEIIDFSVIISLAIGILNRLTADYNSHRGRCINQKVDEPGIALPLSHAVLSLVEVIVNFDSKGVQFEVNDWATLVHLLVVAISACDTSDSRYHEHVAVLCCALTAILTHLDETSTYINLLSGFESHVLKAAEVLTKYSLSTDISDGMKSIARAALSCLLLFVNDRDNDVVVSTTVFSSLFPAASSYWNPKIYAGTLICRLSEFDDDVAILLTNIGRCMGGSDVLVNAGASVALIESAKKYIDSLSSSNDVSVTPVSAEFYRETGAKPPAFLYNHLKLICTLLSSETAASSKHRLLLDSTEFLRIHISSGEYLLSHFPQSASVVSWYITCLYLVSNGMSSKVEFYMDSTLSTLRSPSLVTYFHQNVYSRLQSRIYQLAFNLANNPFPLRYLSPLPNVLYEIERKFQFNDLNMKSWWSDILQDKSSFEVNFVNWLHAYYSQVTISAKCLNATLLLIITWVSISSDSTFDTFLLKKAIFRISDASNILKSTRISSDIIDVGFLTGYFDQNVEMLQMLLDSAVKSQSDSSNNRNLMMKPSRK